MTFIHCRRLFLLLVLVSTSQFATAQAGDVSQGADEPSELRIVASIKPLALIARDLLGEWGRVEVLVKGAASPHDYSLKVSDMRSLGGAHLIIWMGPELERFLEKTLAGLPPERVMALGQHPESDVSRREQDHQHDNDLHQWLDPRLVQDMARGIAKRLQRLYPSAGPELERRLAAQLKAYDQLHRDLKRTIAPVKGVGFVVQHRGYEHFVETYGLNQVAWISRTPEQPPGVRHLYELEKTLQSRPSDQKARCLFVELSHESTTARKLADQLQLELQGLDILGESASSYPELMRNLAGDLVDCFSARR